MFLHIASKVLGCFWYAQTWKQLGFMLNGINLQEERQIANTLKAYSWIWPEWMRMLNLTCRSLYIDLNVSMKVTQMALVDAANLVVNRGNTAFWVHSIYQKISL